ncbi:MAG: MFS transporter, partial [Chloroflexota bacterium]
ALVVLGLGALLMRRAPGEAAAPPTADNPPSAGPVPGDFSLLQAARTGNFWLPFSVMFLLGLCVFSILTHIVPHVIDLGIDPLTAASILSLIGGTSALGGLAAGRLSDSLGSRQTSVIFALVTAGAMLWLTRATSLWMLYVFAVFFGFFYSGLLPSLAALLADLFGLRHLGTLLGARNVAWAVGAAVGPAFTGYVFDLYGNYQAAFWGGLGAMLGIAVLVFFTRIPPTEGKPV